MYTKEEVLGKKFIHKDSKNWYRILSINSNGSYNAEGKHGICTPNWPTDIGTINSWIRDGVWKEDIFDYEIY